ncbi:MAG: hypothetical protein ACE5D4_03285 [Thermodesulfobacteriota bacterium]
MKRQKKIVTIFNHLGRAMQCLLILTVVVFTGVAVLPTQADGAPLDSESTRCLSCHNDSVPYDTADHHPVGVAYSKAATLNPSIQLFNGRVGCATCHVPYSKADHQTLTERRSAIPSIPDPLLIMDNRRSELCQACHNK